MNIRKKTLIALCVCFGFHNTLLSQSKAEIEKDKAAIHEVLNTFMTSLKTKDSTRFYKLFYHGNVTWIGVYKKETQQKRLEKDSKALDHKISDYRTWFKQVSVGLNKEEKFYNVIIETDGSIASVTFDFSFWAGDKKGLWGKESWGLVKIVGQWSISSVIFSMEQESIVPEPNRDH
ncbi:MAG: hypothetical protein EBR30_08880 [Cytophagia bacterium]|nr:hypothetical protein [Cytophagia bacterium]